MAPSVARFHECSCKHCAAAGRRTAAAWLPVSISGTSRATRDPDLIRRLWTEGQRIWFEKGRGDPALVALEIVPIYGEYWDRAGVNRIQFFLAEANALLTGSTLSDEGPGHAKIDFGK